MTPEEENKRYRTALECIEGCCMWAFDLGGREYQPTAYEGENRAQGYAISLQRARVYALKALFPERPENYYDNLLTGDPFAVR